MLPVVHVRDAGKCYEAWEDFVCCDNRVSVCRRIAVQRRLCFPIGGRQIFFSVRKWNQPQELLGVPLLTSSKKGVPSTSGIHVLRDKTRRPAVRLLLVTLPECC
jgi:hypothetical protein